MGSKKKVTRQIKKIVLHHSACENTFEQIRNYHINGRGWSDVFYHYVIEQDGRIREGRDINVFSNNKRQKAIEICVIGKLHKREIYKEQHESLLLLIKKIYNMCGLLKIFGHNDFSATTCPGSLEVKKYNDYILNLNVERRK